MASVEHCLYCFEALAAHLERRKAMSLVDVRNSWKEYANTPAAGASSRKQIPALQRLAETPASDSGTASSGSSVSLGADTALTSTESLAQDPIDESPLFVTWNTISSRSGSRSLRGCIGTFEAQELDTGLSEYALTSALHDTRFSPIDEDELPSLEVAVTLLTDFEDADDAMDWTLGVHGLRISFVYHGRRHGATYLPDVAVEQEWTKEQTLVSLMRKAGWTGRKEKWEDIDLKVVRYQGKKEGLEYAEYKKWRDWVDATKGRS
ncbi:AMMECR1 domain-containing protein [Plectosphaerella cucumerina]|uniref:AMMECR1 domain-containing protein n=1 Tax=Plectosphaerella cucumerina TaxID=40658 RepID=A0A8K0TBT3_9PEZI|nr:AMMECR1 domain-containing protein [Plectosphaerella cucumerina]